MSKIILYIVASVFILLIVWVIWPYGNKYFINSDLKKAALYGTKNTLEDTRRFLNEKLKKREVLFNPEELHLDKDENKTVSIRLTYQDKISFFGIVLKELEFKLVVTERNVEEYL